MDSLICVKLYTDLINLLNEKNITYTIDDYCINVKNHVESKKIKEEKKEKIKTIDGTFFNCRYLTKQKKIFSKWNIQI